MMVLYAVEDFERSGSARPWPTLAPSSIIHISGVNALRLSAAGFVLFLQLTLVCELNKTCRVCPTPVRAIRMCVASPCARVHSRDASHLLTCFDAPFAEWKGSQVKLARVVVIGRHSCWLKWPVFLPSA